MTDNLPLSEFIRERVRTVPDWPQPGVMFRDITPLLSDPRTFRVHTYTVSTGRQIDKTKGAIIPSHRYPLFTVTAPHQDNYSRSTASHFTTDHAAAHRVAVLSHQRPCATRSRTQAARITRAANAAGDSSSSDRLHSALSRRTCGSSTSAR